MGEVGEEMNQRIFEGLLRDVASLCGVVLSYGFSSSEVRGYEHGTRTMEVVTLFAVNGHGEREALLRGSMPVVGEALRVVKRVLELKAT